MWSRVKGCFFFNHTAVLFSCTQVPKYEPLIKQAQSPDVTLMETSQEGNWNESFLCRLRRYSEEGRMVQIDLGMPILPKREFLMY